MISIRIAAALGLALFTGAIASAQAPTAAPSDISGLIRQIAPHPATVAGQAATQLPDGRWLLTGGASGDQSAGTVAVIVDAAGNSATLLAHLAQARSGHSATLLPSGQVFIFGGNDAAGNVLASGELFDPVTQTFSATVDTGLLARSGHSATVVANGQLLIAGGAGKSGQALADVELYTPGCNPCLPQRFPANLNTSRRDQAAALLPNGDVLLWGGTNAGQVVTLGELADTGASAISSVSSATALQYVQALGNAAAPAIVSSQPAANAQSAPLDQPLVIGFSERMDMASFSKATVTLVGPSGPVEINPVPMEYGVLLFVTPKQSLLPSSRYTLFIDGAMNQSGHALPFTAVGFTTAQLNAQAAGNTLVTANGGAAAGTAATTQANAAQPAEATATGDAASIKALALDGEFWVPDASNYHGLWNSNRSILAKLHPPHYEELLRSYQRTEMMLDGRISPAQREAKLMQVRHAAAGAGITSLVGQALRLNGEPLPGVTVRMGKQSAVTDGNGEFLLTGIPSGMPPGPSPMLEIDGRSASTATHQYGRYFYLTHIKPGQVNALRQPVWMTALDMAHAVNIASPSATETVVTNPMLPGLEVHIPAGAVIRDADGKIVTQVSLTPVPKDQLPFPMPYGEVPVYYTLQPGGAVIQSATGKPLGAKIVYPNYSTQPAGARFDLFDYDPSGRGWYVYGNATVSPDGKKLISNKDFVLYQFTASSATGSGGPNPAVSLNSKNGGCGGDPVTCFGGDFMESYTDLAINDTMPLVLQRMYNNRGSNAGSFGVGSASNFDSYLYFPDLNGYIANTIYLATGDGSGVLFNVVGTNNNYINGAVYQSTTPGPFYMAKITLNYDGGNFFVTTKDGTVLTFTYYAPQLMSVQDRLGNSVAITRDINGRVMLVTSQNGHTLSFEYAAPSCTSCVSSVIDNTGRQVSYAYNGAALQQVTDVAGGVTTYSYVPPGQGIVSDTNPLFDEMPIYVSGVQTINDPRNNAGQIAQPKVTNAYYGVADIGPQGSYQVNLGCGNTGMCDIVTYYTYTIEQYKLFGRVKQQTFADGSTFKFAYSFDSSGNVTQTTMTDGLGNVTVKSFQTNGYPTQVVRAQGQPEQQTTTYSWNPSTNLLQSYTDNLGRQTAFTYDGMGNTQSITRLAGTANAVTTSFTYTTDGFNHIATITDPLLHVTTLNYDSMGNLKQVQDANGNAMKFSVTAAGQFASMTNALGNTWSINYDGANPIQITDPLSNVASLTSDASGRVVQVSDPLGNVSQASLDVFDRATQTLDAMKKPTGIAYDVDGNITQVTDANNHAHKYAYDARNKPSGYTDPLNASESYVYDTNGNLTKKTDRKGQITKFGYDHLNRLTGITYSDNSTVVITYDGGNRITQVVDSLNGTIGYGYDGLDRIASVTTVSGSVSYTYYANGLRKTMTVSGQPTVTYIYDAGNRLTQISQAAGTANGNQSQNVNYAYDTANRLTQKLLPNGTSMVYTYDNVNRVAAITYYQGSTVIGNLTYAYDAAGHRTTVGGSFARFSQTPATSATVDAANRLTSFNGGAFQYDANGSLINDGQNVYVWNARNQLVSISGAQRATFSYDAMGRRISKTINGVTSNYVYDGWNIVGETSTDTTFLTGLGIDEVLAMETSSGEDLQIASYFTDALGSTIRLTDINGNKLVDYTYSIYGTTTADSASINPFQYVGRENDGDGLYYYRARYYAPSMQRFISQDTIGISGGVNFYAYVYGNPISARDPSGNCPWCISVPVGIVVGAFAGGIGLAINNPNASFSDYAQAVGIGALAGAVGGATLNPWAVGAVAGALGDVGGQYVAADSQGKDFANEFNPWETVTQSAVGLFAGGGGALTATAFAGAPLAGEAVYANGAAALFGGTYQLGANAVIPSSLGGYLMLPPDSHCP